MLVFFGVRSTMGLEVVRCGRVTQNCSVLFSLEIVISAVASVCFACKFSAAEWDRETLEP